ncbi:MAG: type IV pilus assembly protein PilY1 [Candidatus Krumholzibacteriia bacterium]|jgi:type IV pilus assembly protein PilY1
MTGGSQVATMLRNKKTWRPDGGAPVVSKTAFLFIICLASASATFAQECEIPLFVKQGQAGANVMILADNSGSMNEAMTDQGYDASVVYAGDFPLESMYYVRRDGSYTPRSFNRNWPSSPAANLVNSDNGQYGRYPGNYLNYIYFTLSDVGRGAIPQVTRIQVLKSVLLEIVDNSKILNFGLTKFRLDRGGNVVANCSKNRTAIKAQINGLTANTWTPLGEAMETVLDYFSSDKPDAPIQESCQYNFVLVVTDGLPTKDLGVSGYLHDADGDGKEPGNCTSIGAPYNNSYDCSDYFDDVAYYMAHEDLRPDLEGDQNVITYVVGFNQEAPLLQEAADNGDGLFFHAQNAGELTQSIEWAIQDVLRRISAGSAVAVVSTERGDGDHLYRGKFMPLDWDGFLESYELPYQDGDTPVWEAGELLSNRAMSSREIFTGLGSNRHSFTENNASTLRDALGAADDMEAAELIAWGRGDDVPGYRRHANWPLGDIVHSTPVVVGPPAGFIPTEQFQNFRTANENRRKLVYVGANDGMVHAFDADSGQEHWAFVPEFALPSIAAMADSGYCHEYSCDQTVSVKDVRVGGAWKTVLVSGGGAGSSAIFALDITDPEDPELMWQADLPNGKSSHSEVEMFSVGGTAMALVGGGLDEDTGEAWVYAYQLDDGSALGWVRLSADDSARNMSTKPAIVDLDLDGEVDLIYIGDMLGSVYRIDVNGSPYPGNWSSSKLYSGSQEITADPVAAFGPNGSVYVYFGTGVYLTDDDVLATNQESFVCVFDAHSGLTHSKSDLANQSSTIQDVTNEDGWYVDLWNNDGERVTEIATVVAETVIFTSYSPTGEACTAGGTSWLYQLRYDTGGLSDNNESGNNDDRSVLIGEGVASYPVVDLAAGEVVVQLSNAEINVSPIGSAFVRMKVRSWQENFDHIAAPPEVP